jgi:prepilin-type N-terminal cleavage/methylation domain-containing protein
MIRRRLEQSGFTIVELMIALSVFAVTLLLSTTVIITIGRLYTKGVSSANLQDATRSVLNDITSTLEFSDEQPAACTPSSPIPITCSANQITSAHPDHSAMIIYAYCIGTTRYSYTLDTQAVDSPQGTQSYHALWKDKMATNANCYPLNIAQTTPSVAGSPSAQASVANSGHELAPLRSRITRFYVEPQSADGSRYAVDLWLAAGEDDLLTTNTTGASCTSGTGSSTCAGYATCQSSTGQQYCASTQLSTTITRRLN